MLVALRVVEDAFSSIGCDTIVTSGNDGKHKDGSYHYVGRAFDFRTKHTGRSTAVVEAVKKELCPLGFDVILEDLHGPNEHLHCEYDPK